MPVEENNKRDGLVEKSDGTEKNGDRNEDEENIKRDGLADNVMELKRTVIEMRMKKT